jgi:hypothetical protein
MNKLFDRHIRVTHDRISTIIEALTGACEVIKIEQYSGPIVNRSHKKGSGARVRTANMSYAGGIRNKGISGKELLRVSLQEGPKTLEQLVKIFMDRGFAATSPSPLISVARKNGKVHIDHSGLITWRAK